MMTETNRVINPNSARPLMEFIHGAVFGLNSYNVRNDRIRILFPYYYSMLFPRMLYETYQVPINMNDDCKLFGCQVRFESPTNEIWVYSMDAPNYPNQVFKYEL